MKKTLIILVITIFAGAGIIYYSIPLFKQSPGVKSVAAATNEKIFTVEAKKWNFSPNVITVKKGEKVKIYLNNADFLHGIIVPDFNASGDDSVEFVADKIGEFVFYCKNFCGSGHADMKGKIIVTN